MSKNSTKQLVCRPPPFPARHGLGGCLCSSAPATNSHDHSPLTPPPRKFFLGQILEKENGRCALTGDCVAQASRPAVSRVSNLRNVDWYEALGLLSPGRFGNRRYGSFGKPRYERVKILRHQRFPNTFSAQSEPPSEILQSLSILSPSLRSLRSIVAIFFAPSLCELNTCHSGCYGTLIQTTFPAPPQSRLDLNCPTAKHGSARFADRPAARCDQEMKKCYCVGDPFINLRFVDLYEDPHSTELWGGVIDDDENTWYSGSIMSAMSCVIQDCHFHGGEILVGPPSDEYYELFYAGDHTAPTCQIALTNNLFERVNFWVTPSDTNPDPDGPPDPDVDMRVSAYNNLFWGGSILIGPAPTSQGNWAFMDNLFDQMPITQDTGQPLDYDHNAYWPVSPPVPYTSSTLEPSTTGTVSGASDIVLTSAPAYQPGPFGNYYLPTSSPLYNAGSRSPADAGFFHYTTRLDQVKEGSEASGHMANIGLHYIAAVDASTPVPVDTDGDGIPDYVENWHGDGNYSIHTDTETDWQNQYTAAGIFDPTNSIYDNMDLDGDRSDWKRRNGYWEPIRWPKITL